MVQPFESRHHKTAHEGSSRLPGVRRISRHAGAAGTQEHAFPPAVRTAEYGIGMRWGEVLAELMDAHNQRFA